MLRRAGSFLFGFACAVALPLCAQTPAAPPSQTPPSPAPLLKSETREVIVDVVVAKSNGKPIRGLNKQDFQVFEDGKPQPIDFFEEHSSAPLNQSAPPQLPPMPPGAVTNAPTAPASSAVNVLLLDYLNTEPQDQAYVHQQIMQFLHKMKPGTRMAIFLLGSQLRCVQGFTSDGSELVAALKKDGSPSRETALHTRSDNAFDEAQLALMAQMQHSPDGIAAMRAAMNDVRDHDYSTRANLTFQALNYLAQYLAGVPGRKNLIWFAGSFPVLFFPTAEQHNQAQTIAVPGQSQPQTPTLANTPTDSRMSALGEFRLQNRRTADLLTGSRVSVYPVGAQGMMTEHVMEADNAGPGSMDGAGRGGSMSPYSNEASERAGLTTQMQRLAANTGGQAFYNTNNIAGAIRTVVENSSEYYTLGYTPQHKKMNGEYRSIEVRVSGGHDKLFYRRGYNADPRPPIVATSTSDPLSPLLKFGLPNATGVLFGVRAVPMQGHVPDDAARLGDSTALKGPLTRFEIHFLIRASDIRFEPAANGDLTGKIHVGIIAFDQDGAAVNWISGDQQMNITQGRYEQLLKTGIPAQMKIDLPDKNLWLLTGVYDDASTRAGTLQIALRPGSAAPSLAANAPVDHPNANANPSSQPPPIETRALTPASLRKLTQINVDQLQQILAAEQSAHKSDGAIADRLASVQLTERLSRPALENIAAQIHPGPRTAEALDILSDISALFPPPSTAFLDEPAPPMKTQGSIYQAAIDYVVNTLTRLPNFIATRSTRSFDNAPLVVGHSGFAPATDEHLVGTFERQITFRDGKEAPELDASGKPKTSDGPRGLATWGEFGPALAIVLSDSVKGHVRWSHWEQTPEGKLAVFHYRVPKSASHFVVSYCCSWKQRNSGAEASTAGFRANPTNQYSGTGPSPKAEASISYRGTPAYHGDLSIDPQTGAVLRVTVDAELEDSAVLTQASLAIQYAKVNIGEKTYICPVRSVALSADRDRPGIAVVGQSDQILRLNETTFTNYHRFGSTSRILSNAP